MSHGRHTLRFAGGPNNLWQWTYRRGMFFWSGVSPSRKAAIRALLEARREAAACSAQLERWVTA